ncbi:MAG: hypothetical protein V4764_09555 [Burkholderia sp.]
MNKRPMMRRLGMVAILILLQGCGAPKPYSFSLADFLSVDKLPYDSPPQVIYRIDDHRFVTLEKYRDCNHGEAFYNDARANIHSSIGIGLFENYQGRLINSDPEGANIVLPLSYPNRTVCGDRGCVVPLIYSVDGGVSFDVLTYMPHSFSPFKDSKEYTIVATRDAMYVAYGRENDDLHVKEYPLRPGLDLSSPYPPGIHSTSFMASTRPGFLSKFHTPSGQDRIECDASIKPTNPDARLVP